MDDLTISQKIARVGAELKFEDLPGEVIENSKKSVLDLFGCILGAKEVASSKIITDTVFEIGGNQNSTVIGYGVKTAPTMAALANATMGHAFDMDDDHREGTQHSSVVVLPAVLSVAEKLGMDGKSILTAFVFGSEVTIRLGEAFLGKSYYQGFHPTGTCGVFGAAAGASKVLGLNQEQITLALGIAGSESSGLLEWRYQGAWTKRFQAGHASMSGVLAALMAKRGYTSPKTIIEGEDGFIRAYSFKDTYDLNRITDGLGEKWEMVDNSIKVHSCCRFCAPPADCALELHKQGIKPEDVSEIIAKISDFTIRSCCNPPDRKYRPQTIVDAQFSVPYAIAVGICKGQATVTEFTDEAIKDPQVIELTGKVRWEEDPEATAVYPRHYPATVIVKMKDGREYVSHIDYPKGDPENPVSFSEVEDKFRFLAGLTLGKNKVEKVINYVRDLESQKDISNLISCLY